MEKPGREWPRVEEHEMAAHPFIPSQYNDFLFATIGEQKNETPLSVLSALTRLDLDPWQEAARLTRLPKEEARRDIGCALAALPGGGWTVSESGRIAGRLVELLPSSKDDESSLAADRIGSRVALALAVMWIVFAGAWMAFVVGMSGTHHPQMHAASTISAQQLPSMQSH
jgi:hypothetical protein